MWLFQNFEFLRSRDSGQIEFFFVSTRFNILKIMWAYYSFLFHIKAATLKGLNFQLQDSLIFIIRW